ncbi:Coenzyme F420 hydrogenase/dehydrogenase, beta subunit C-terminal domain [Zunongwangia profunda]|nr:Coenzyme F420 hydrogenase/dehydrogenase, beta subunit C-terminal domain [Zunongwangia profunda]
MNKVPKVITHVVNNDLCTGCGLCTSFCDSKALKMDWNEFGFLVPHEINDCTDESDCLSVCPFNPFPEETVKTETEIANLFFPDDTTTKKLEKLGKYKNTYVGYSNEFRATSSSGGIASYVTKQLFERNIIEYVVNVQQVGEKFEYSINKKGNPVVKSSKTRYYPVTMDKVFQKIEELDGNVAIVSIPCFLKGVRLAQYQRPALKEKINFTIGIICGGVKSKFFTEYLTQKAGAFNDDVEKVEYRVKNLDSTAGDYSFGVKVAGKEDLKTVKMRSLGDMWGTGLFKCNACDFCDDVSGELADIALGDAWIRPYVNDGGGTNVMITRSNLADTIIKQGMSNGDLHADDLPESEFIRSQKGSFTHRQDCLPYRADKLSNIENIPPKRPRKKRLSPEVKLIQKKRRETRKQSLLIWKDNPNVDFFDLKMKPYLKSLRSITKFNHYKRGIIDRMKRMF